MTNYIEIFQGTTVKLDVTVNGGAVVLTGAKIYFTMKEDEEDDSAEIVLLKRNTDAGGGADEIQDTDLPNSEFRIHLKPADTKTIDPRTYQYDVLVMLGTDEYIVIKDKIKVKARISD